MINYTNCPEIFNAVEIKGALGFGWRIKKRLRDMRIMHRFALAHKISAQGTEIVQILFLQPVNVGQLLLNYKLKYNLEIQPIQTAITVKLQPESNLIDNE